MTKWIENLAQEKLGNFRGGKEAGGQTFAYGWFGLVLGFEQRLKWSIGIFTESKQTSAFLNWKWIYERHYWWNIGIFKEKKKIGLPLLYMVIIPVKQTLKFNVQYKNTVKLGTLSQSPWDPPHMRKIIFFWIFNLTISSFLNIIFWDSVPSLTRLIFWRLL
jgi:hypothetical protein